MRVLQGHGLGAVQDDPAEGTDAKFVDARRAGGQDEMRPVRQAAPAILWLTDNTLVSVSLIFQMSSVCGGGVQ
jgi:hypothetical protein